MKHIACAFFVILFISSAVVGQEPVFSIKPEKPKIGDRITITYNGAAKNALFKDVKEIFLCACFIEGSSLTSLAEVKMEKKENLWQGSFELKEKAARVILFRFDSGDITDDNNQNCWLSLVYNGKGNPLEQGHSTLGMLYKYGGLSNGFPVLIDKEKSIAENALETKFYPEGKNSLEKLFKSYNEKPSDVETAAQIETGIIKYYNENKSDETAVLNVVSMLRSIKRGEKADELTAEYLKINPNGKLARKEREKKVYSENDKQKRIEIINKVFAENPGLSKDERELYEISFAQALIYLKRYDEAYDFISKVKNPNALMYNALAWGALEKGDLIEKATGWAKIGIDILRNPNPATKPSNIPMKDWKNNNQMYLAYNLDTYAYGLDLLNKPEEAEKAYDEVFAISKTPLGEDYYVRYIDCLLKNRKYEKAIMFAEESLDKGMKNEKLIEAYKTAFIKLKGTAADFEKKLALIKEDGKKKAKGKLYAGLINKPAPEFSFKTMNGETLTLDDLKGKIVVVDFWATWCGPCKVSFPALQKVYEKYKSNKDVVILAVNAWENLKGADREKAVKQFIQENKYSFPVMFDHDEKEKAFITQFGVEGIPTKFFLDKQGNIQFETVGFLGEQAMLDEMDLQLEILLDNDYKTKTN